MWLLSATSANETFTVVKDRYYKFIHTECYDSDRDTKSENYLLNNTFFTFRRVSQSFSQKSKMKIRWYFDVSKPSEHLPSWDVFCSDGNIFTHAKLGLLSAYVGLIINITN